MKNHLIAAAMTILFAANSFGASPLPAAECAKPPVAPAVEEFNGPFASWKNLKVDFGAVGDGKTDDTAAFKAGLDALAEHGKGKPGAPYVLYLPAGTYRITAPLVWENRLGVALLGEDPAKTIVRYDGPAGQAMLTCHGVSYSKFGRITWDGQGKARAAVALPGPVARPSWASAEPEDSREKTDRTGTQGIPCVVFY